MNDVWNVIILSTILIIGAGLTVFIALALASAYAALND